VQKCPGPWGSKKQRRCRGRRHWHCTNVPGRLLGKFRGQVGRAIPVTSERTLGMSRMTSSSGRRWWHHLLQYVGRRSAAMASRQLIQNMNLIWGNEISSLFILEFREKVRKELQKEIKTLVPIKLMLLTVCKAITAKKGRQFVAYVSFLLTPINRPVVIDMSDNCRISARALRFQVASTPFCRPDER
ncbi:hypothetical protein Taro_043931, partial [Colocasia esculenta]|nr:hypothetical protein [Colocasia esculenta]